MFVRGIPVWLIETLEKSEVGCGMTGFARCQSPQFNPSSLGNVGEPWQVFLLELYVSLMSGVDARVKHNRPS